MGVERDKEERERREWERRVKKRETQRGRGSGRGRVAEKYEESSMENVHVKSTRYNHYHC